MSPLVRIQISSFILWISFCCSMTLQASSRSVFLNGIDISSAKHQILENVTVRIDGQGQVFIEAPHYEVNEESTYIPLSTWNRQEGGLPSHQNTGPLPRSRSSLSNSEALDHAANGSAPVDSVLSPKPGTKRSDASGNDGKEVSHPNPEDPRSPQTSRPEVPAIGRKQTP